MTSLSGVDIKRHLNLFSLYLLYCGAFLYFSIPSLGRPLLELFLVASTISVLWHLPKIWRSPVFLLLGSCVLLQIASWVYCKQNFPQYAGSSPDLKRLGHLFLFVPIAWTLQANSRRPWMLMVLFFAGLSLAPFSMGNGVNEFLGAERPGFGFRNAQHAALMFAMSLVALVAFRKRAFDYCGFAKNVAFLALAFAVLYCVAIVAIADTRGVFLGLLAGVLLAGMVLLLKSMRPKRREVLMVVTLAMIMAASLSLMSNPFFRWLSEVETVKLLVSGDTSSIPKDTSSGIRIHTWIEGWKWFVRSPLVGWGENGKNLAIKESSALPESVRNEFGHLHNSYMETLVNNGILGLAFLIALHVWIGGTVIKACRQKGIKDVQFFSLVAGTLWLTANFFESFMFYRTGVMVFGISSASLLAASGYNFGVSSPADRNERLS